MASKTVSQDARLVLSGLLLMVAVFQALFFWVVRHEINGGKEDDFIAFYTAGRIIRDGSPARLYDYELQKKLEMEVNPKYDPALVYYHPAFEALLFVPFGHVSYTTATAYWVLLNLALLAALPALLWRYLQLTSELLPTVLFLSFFSFFPIGRALLQGQDSILLLFLVVLAFRSLEQGNDFSAGCFLGFGLFRFQLILPLALLFLLRKRLRVLLGLLSVGTVLEAVSLGIVGYRGTLDYVTLLYRLNHDPTAQHIWSWSIHPTRMPTLRGFLDISLSGSVPGVYRTGFYLILSCLIILAVARTRSARNEKSGVLPLLYGLDLIAALAISYHSYMHDLALLILPLLFCIESLLNPAVPLRSRKLFAGLTILLFLPPVYLLLLVRDQVAFLFTLILALGVLIWREIASGKAERQSPRMGLPA
jgi:hypothetical protein